MSSSWNENILILCNTNMKMCIINKILFMHYEFSTIHNFRGVRQSISSHNVYFALIYCKRFHKKYIWSFVEFASFKRKMLGWMQPGTCIRNTSYTLPHNIPHDSRSHIVWVHLSYFSDYSDYSGSCCICIYTWLRL